MGLLQRAATGLANALLRASTQVSVAAQGWTIVRGDQPTQYQATGRNVRIQGWERHPIVHACCRAIVDIMASVPLQVYTLDSDGDPQILTAQESELAARLEQPRVAMTQQRLIALTGTHILLYGNGFWKLERPGESEMPPGDALAPGPILSRQTKALPSSLRLVHPEHILYAFLDAETLEVLQWQWRDRIGRVHYARAEDMLHFPDVNASDWVFGYPRAATAINAIVGDNEASEYVRQVVTNDGTPTAVFLTEATSDVELKAARERWHERVVQRGERGRAEFLAGVKDIKAIGFNLRDLEFPDLRRVTHEQICTAFGVDPHVIGIVTAQGRSSSLSGQQFQDARFRLIHSTVKPLMALLEAQMNLWLTPEYGEQYVRFDPDALAELTDDADTRSKRLIAEVGAGIRTLEEARPLVGLESDMDPEHTVAALSTVAFKDADDLVQEAPEPGEPGTTPGTGAAVDPALAAANGNGNGKKPVGTVPTPRDQEFPAPVTRALHRGVVLTPAQRTQLWRMADARATSAEAPYRQAAEAEFAHERALVASRFAQHGREANPEEQALLAAILSYLREQYGNALRLRWARAFEDLIRQTMAEASAQVAPAVKLSPHLVTERVNKLAGGVTQTTYDRISAIVDQGRAEGWPMRQIAEQIDAQVFQAEAPERSVTIARTETIGAQNAGAFAAARASGVIGAKEWLTQGDDRVRDTHAAIDGQRIPMDQPFDNGLQYPGDQSGPASEVVNCRCTLLFHAGSAHEIPAGRQLVLDALKGGS